MDDLTRLYRAHVAGLEAAYGRILSDAGFDAVVIHSGSPRPRTEFDDQYWSLRPTPHFQHWLPLPEPDCALVVRAGHKPLLVWPRPANFWEKAAPYEADFWRDSFNISTVADVDQVRPLLDVRGRTAFIGEDARRAAAWSLTEQNPPALVKALDRLRVHKSAYEIACIDEANRIAAHGHRTVAAAFREGDRSELDLHLLYLGATGQDDPETPYKNIVALGEHAATLHHVSYAKRARTRTAESLLLDAGAAVHGYCSDITRTWVKGDGPTASAFGELVSRTEALQRHLCGSVALGKPYEQLHDEAHQLVAASLVDLGISRLSADETVATGMSRAFFPHGLGHSLGLQCHDVGCAEIKPRPDNPFLRNTTVIAENQVFTIEPGIYFIDMLLAPLRQGPSSSQIDWKLVDALAELGGVRIEDDIQVLASGTRNFTRDHLD